MRIAIAASGTRGDVQPYVALGKGLAQSGHQVSLITSDDFASLANEAGLELRSIGASIEGMLQDDAWRKTVEKGNFLTILAKMQTEMKSCAQALAQRQPDLFSGAELVVAGLGGFGGAFSIAEKLNIPAVQAYVFPITPTSQYASPLMPADSLGAPLNKISYTIMQQALWMTSNAADGATRQRLGMGKMSMGGHLKRLKSAGSPTLYGYSDHVLPRPRDWDNKTHITGYWFLDPPHDYQPPADLVEFLHAGSPPVYIGYGSMGSQNPEQAAELAIKALELSGQRGTLASGWGGMSQNNLPANVHMIKSAPHSWLFPRMAAVVHHGGAGTTAAGLRAGVPTIIVPYMGDQPFWARRVTSLGVGMSPAPRKKLTAEKLAQAITRAVTDREMRQRAAELGEKICAEDGVARAVQLIEQYAKR